MPEPEAQVAEKPVEIKEAPKPVIKMGQSLSSQSAKLTKLLQDAPVKEEEEKKEEPAKEEPEAEIKPEVTPPPVPPAPEPETQPAPVELGPIEKYVIDKLPTLSVLVKDGEGFKTLKFKDTSELPMDFEIANDAARAQFTTDIAAQTGRAKDAINEYRQTELNNNVRAFEAQESRDVAADLARLQKQGVIPKFEYSDDDPKFNDDPAVKTANEIYDLFKKTNQEYIRTNKTYRITYADAADKYFATKTRQENSANESQKAKEQPTEKKPKEKTAAQKEREAVANKQGAPAGGEAKAERPRVRSGMQLSDINRLIAQGRI